MMNDSYFSKEEILLNTYNMAKEMCKHYVEELAVIEDENLYNEYLDLLEDQLDIAREISEMLVRNKYKKPEEVDDNYIDKVLTGMVKKLESVSTIN